MMNRREFVGLLGCLTAAGGLGIGLGVRTWRRVAIGDLVPATARPLQGTSITLVGRDGHCLSAVVESVQTVRRRAQRDAPGTEQILLLVRADRQDASAGNYRLRTEDLELDELLFSEVGAAGSQRRLEAVINRIV